MEVFLGMIALFGFNYAPRGWMFCAGQTLSVAEYSAIFALLGTFYGGNGVNTFRLPDLRGRVAVGFGQGDGLPDYRIGQMGGETNVTLTTQTMPAHNHTATATSTSTVNGENTPGTAPLPQHHIFAGSGSTTKIYADPAASTPVAMADQAVATTTTVEIAQNGGNLPHDNMQPYVALNYCIAMQGIFPSRN